MTLWGLNLEIYWETMSYLVMNRGAGGLFVRLTRFVQWRFLNLNAIFNAYVGAEKQTLMVYCDVIESTVVGA